MSVELTTILYILLLHLIGDFFLQSNWMAINKSTSWKALTIHSVTYTIPLLLINPLWAIINGVLHGIVDSISSRITSYYYKKGDTHNFFIIIGIDQTIHYIALIYTYVYFIN